jgi:hypothetical protein
VNRQWTWWTHQWLGKFSYRSPRHAAKTRWIPVESTSGPTGGPTSGPGGPGQWTQQWTDQWTDQWADPSGPTSGDGQLDPVKVDR